MTTQEARKSIDEIAAAHPEVFREKALLYMLGHAVAQLVGVGVGRAEIMDIAHGLVGQRAEHR